MSSNPQHRERRDGESVDVVRSEERLSVGTTSEEVGRLRARKHVDSEHTDNVVSRDVEHADVERVGPDETDSGEIETLPDGSISIPIFEEQLVVEKRLVVRERVVIRKRTIAEEHRVEADLRRERLEIDVPEELADRVITDTE